MLTSVLSTVLGWALSLLLALLPFIVTGVLAVFAWKLWRSYLLRIHVSTRRWKLLEIKLPREIFKSPKAMELVLTAMWQSREGPAPYRLKNNNRRPWYALEIISDGGEIHFYIYTEDQFEHIVRSALYANYPDVQVFEVEDYATKITWEDPDSTWQFDAMEYGLKREDAYPIKTYVDYELDKETKEELKHDPLAQMLEAFSMVSPDEKFWFQIVITADKTGEWKDEGKELVEKLLERDREIPEGKFYFPPPPTKVEQDTVAAIQRSMDKLAYHVGIRFIYWFPKGKESFARGTSLYSFVNYFNSEHLNSFHRYRDIGYPYFWTDPLWNRDRRDRYRFHRGYVDRSYFYPPVERKDWCVMTTEEIATLFHLPGEVASPPTLERIESKRGEAPINLPR